MANYVPIGIDEYTRSAEIGHVDKDGYVCNPDGTRWVVNHCTPVKEATNER